MPLERSVLILYGSETGNAQEVAEELGALTERLRFATHVSELNQCKPVCDCFDKQDYPMREPCLMYTGNTFLLHAYYIRGVNHWTR
jgi:hypothetical protein